MRKFKKYKTKLSKRTWKFYFQHICLWTSSILIIVGASIICISLKSFKYFINLDNVYKIETNNNKINQIKNEFDKLSKEINNEDSEMDIQFISNIKYNDFYNSYISLINTTKYEDNGYLNFFVSQYLNNSTYKINESMIDKYKELKSYTYSWYILLNNSNKIKPSYSNFVIGSIITSLSTLSLLSLTYFFIRLKVKNKNKSDDFNDSNSENENTCSSESENESKKPSKKESDSSKKSKDSVSSNVSNKSKSKTKNSSKAKKKSKK